MFVNFFNAKPPTYAICVGGFFMGALKEFYMFDFSSVMAEPWQMIVLFVVIIAILAAAFIVTAIVEKRLGIVRVTGTREITYGAICLAASFALSFVSVFKMPFGGSITLASILPIALYCYYFGLRKSLVVCFTYTLLQFMQNPYIISPWSALLDYLLPYLALCLIGVFSYKPNKYETVLQNGKNPIRAHGGIFIGFALYFVVRYASHILAGVLFWSEGISFWGWQGDLVGWAAFSYSAVYNGLFLLPDTLIAAACALFILSNKAFNAFMAKSFYAIQNSDTRAKND